MPRKTKELQETPVKDTKKIATKKAATKKVASTSKNSTITKKTETKKDTNKNAITKTSTKTSRGTTTKKATKKDTISKTTKRKPSGTISKRKSTTSTIEYYDLPVRYNQTIVKILAQTPNMLFVYWDIADIDRKTFEEHYGNNFFKETKPVLIVRNETMNYFFEIEINDFANSWYLHINDPDCKYNIELGRRPLTHISTIKDNYIYVSSSNKIDSPNNHILFERFNPNVTYRNLKNGNTVKRDFSSLSKYKNMQEIYNIYDLYKTIYKDELFGEITNENITNPSSISSSSFK